MMIRRTFSAALLATVLALMISSPALAQANGDWNPRGLKMERTELQQLMEELNGVAASSGYSSRVRDRAERDVNEIRRRLEHGDFRTGDRIRIRMEGHPTIPEELPVQPGPQIALPVWGSIALDGVLRSELQEHLTREIGRFVQDPVIVAESLVRLSIQGNVGSPGFYAVPSDMLLGEALMHAGGPAGDADLEKIRIERMGEELWEGTELRDIIAEGRTLDQMNLRAGDQIVVPPKGSSNWGRIGRWALGTTASVFVAWLTFRGRN